MMATTPLSLPSPFLAPATAAMPLLPASTSTPALQAFSSLEAWLSTPAALQLPLHQIELQQEIRGRQLQCILLQSHVLQRGTGDVGPALLVASQSSTTLFPHRRLQRRTLKTIFGPIDIDRTAYCRDGAASIHPLDEIMQLPARSFSYPLQKRLIKAAVQGPFRQSMERIQEAAGLIVAMRTVEQLLQEAARDFDAFYGQRLCVPPSSASIVVAAVDCKGIPMVNKDRPRGPARHTKGRKANRKRMATVATVFSRAPWVRSPQQVVDSLFRTVPLDSAKSAATPPPPRPENKRVWASLLKGKDAVIDEVAAEVRRRDPDSVYLQIALTDGERALQIRITKKMPVLLILDLLHVLEKVWKAAHVFHPEGSPEAELYARLMALRILEGNSCQVVKGLRQTVTKQSLFGAKRKTLLAVAAYFHRNRDRMRYDQYLAQGLPIASGPVEGACKNLINDRMERSGMRWTALVAEAMLKLRAIYLSGDFDAYWDFHITQEQLRLYPPGRWTVVVK